MIRILFVCLGNICRSPLAEAILNEKIRINGLQSGLACDSAGTIDYHVGESPHTKIVEVANRNNIPISHRSRQFRKEDAVDFQYLIAMDRSNYRDIIAEAGHEPDHLFLMRDFDPLGKGEDMPDPYYVGGFEKVYEILDRSMDEFISYIRQTHGL